MTNHLILGLGGNGGKIIRSFRKLIYRNFRAEDPTGVNIRYFYVDSNDEMMKDNDPTWKVLGTSVQLKNTSKLLIRGMNLGQVLEDLNNYPGIGPWLGNRDLFRQIIIAADAANVFGGQKRRLGRFLFACKINDFRKYLQALAKEMQTGGTVDTVFHVCCGLAGGTGSGSVVDAVVQIRSMYPDVRHKIVIYALLPERDPHPDWAGPNYHANGYAALAELNALAVGAYQPHDISGATNGRLSVQDPFNCCYLFTDENEAGNRVDIDKELPDIVASFLYQKIVAVRNFTWDSLRRQESFELGTQAREAESSPATNKPERCRLFFSFGVKQIAYPEQEIRELLTYEFTRQSARQLRFNNWTDSEGFIEEARNQNFNETVTQKETLENWRITDDHLCLSLGILPAEIQNKRWKPINAFWTDLLPNLKTFVRENLDGQEKRWLDKLALLCEEHYAQNYRDSGVAKFYELKANDIGDQVREIRKRIEEGLFADWRTGAKSIHDVSRLLDALLQSLAQRKNGMDDKTARARDSQQQTEAILAENRKQWANIGWISAKIGARDRLFDKQAEILAENYIHKTRALGWQYAKKLLESLIAEITALAAEVGRAASMIKESTENFETAIKARCSDRGRSDLTKQMIRFYDPQVVRDFAKRLVRDKGEQLKQTNSVRQNLSELLAEDQRFSAFNAKIDKEKFIQSLESTCVKRAEEAHDALLAKDQALSPILRVNVVDQLQKEYGTNREALRIYATEVVKRARSFLPLDDAEPRSGPGVPAGDTCFSYLTIIMPEARNPEFGKRLADELSNAKPGQKELITIPGDGKEITLIDVRNVFPARFVYGLKFLKGKYEVRAAAASFELHGEADGKQLPELYLRRVAPREVFPYLLIAKSMNLVQRLADDQTGVEALYLVLRDARGHVDAFPLGSDFDKAAQNATWVTLDQLDAVVQEKLRTDFLHKAKRDELIRSIHADAEALLAEVKSPLNARYKAYLEAANRAEEILSRR